MNLDQAVELATEEPAEPEGDGTRRVEIDLDHRGVGRVVVDGRDLARHVSGVEVDAEPGEMTEVTLRLTVADRVRFDGAARVEVDVETAAVLRLLGWTPPDEGLTGYALDQHIADTVQNARGMVGAFLDRAVVHAIAGDRR